MTASQHGAQPALPIARSAGPAPGDLEASRAARAALQAVWPLPDKVASLEAQNAIAYASNNHTEWFWSGVGGRQAFKMKEAAVCGQPPPRRTSMDLGPRRAPGRKVTGAPTSDKESVRGRFLLQRPEPERLQLCCQCGQN